MFDKIKQWFKDFWTKSWSRIWGHIQLWSGMLTSAFAMLGEVLNDNTVKNAADALHLDPRISMGLALFGAITLMARSHK